jgi:hypothetical protein
MPTATNLISLFLHFLFKSYLGWLIQKIGRAIYLYSNAIAIVLANGWFWWSFGASRQ